MHNARCTIDAENTAFFFKNNGKRGWKDSTLHDLILRKSRSFLNTKHALDKQERESIIEDGNGHRR